jgi:hypothetical protein
MRQEPEFVPYEDDDHRFYIFSKREQLKTKIKIICVIGGVAAFLVFPWVVGSLAILKFILF